MFQQLLLATIAIQQRPLGCDEVVKSCLFGFFFVFFGGECVLGDDGEVWADEFYLSCCLESIHHRHFNVHKDEMISGCCLTDSTACCPFLAK